MSAAGVVQRWRARRDSYRPAGEPIATHLYEVAVIPDDGSARAFVVEHHYSGTYPAARFRVGLYRGRQLQGVAVFSHPCSDRVLTRVFPGPASLAVELGRFVLLDEVAANGETWFLGQAFAALRREGIEGVISFSDPVARRRATGEVVFPGHIGTIYQAHNGLYLGRGTPRTLHILPDGTVFSARAAQKLRAGERGWSYAARQLQRHGAPPIHGERAAWLAMWMPRVTRRLRHPGCHRYAWPLVRPRRKGLVALGQAPKRLDGASQATLDLG